MPRNGLNESTSLSSADGEGRPCRRRRPALRRRGRGGAGAAAINAAAADAAATPRGSTVPAMSPRASRRGARASPSSTPSTASCGPDPYHWMRRARRRLSLGHLVAERDWYDVATAHLAPLVSGSACGDDLTGAGY